MEGQLENLAETDALQKDVYPVLSTSPLYPYLTSFNKKRSRVEFKGSPSVRAIGSFMHWLKCVGELTVPWLPDHSGNFEHWELCCVEAPDVMVKVCTYWIWK